MQHTITVDKGGSLFTVRTKGDGNLEGCIALFKDIVSHRQWKPGKDLLLDHRGLALDRISISGIEMLSRYVKSIASELGGGKLALVMNREVDFGIARAWEIITENDVAMPIRVFRQLDNALLWLNDQKPAPEPVPAKPRGRLAEDSL